MVRLANRAARSALDILVSGSFRFFSPSLSLFFPFFFVHDETIIRVNRVTRMMGQRRYERNRSELISYHHPVLSNLLRFSRSTRSDGTALSLFSFLFFFFWDCSSDHQRIILGTTLRVMIISLFFQQITLIYFLNEESRTMDRNRER